MALTLPNTVIGSRKPDCQPTHICNDTAVTTVSQPCFFENDEKGYQKKSKNKNISQQA